MSVQVLLATLVVALAVQQLTPREALDRIREILASVEAPPPPPPAVVHVPCGEPITPAWEALAPGGTLTLASGCVYAETVTLAPSEGASEGLRKTLTTQGWGDSGAGWAGLVRPADQPRMATIRGVATTGYVLQVENGANAGYLDIVGVALEGCPPLGQCDLLQVGHGSETDPDAMATDVRIRQVLLKGDPSFGTRRGILASGRDIDISQVWCQDVWIAGQDTQCVASARGGIGVTIRHSYLQAGSENIIVGGATIPDARFMPQDWLIEDVILHKPLRWQSDGRNRQVKNLLEFKHGRNLTARRVLAVNTWRAAQDGRGILINYTTNGRCPSCGGLENVLLEDVVLLNAVGGINFQGYSYDLRSENTRKLFGATVRNAYFVLGNGRPITVANVYGRHDIRVERSTIIHTSTKFFEGDYGSVWLHAPDGTPTRVPGGPVDGLALIHNVITRAGTYQVTAPSCSHRAEALGAMRSDGCGPFVVSELEVAGNVIGDLSSTTAARLNVFRRAGAENTSATETEMLARLPIRACAEWAVDAGADCTRLAPVFAMLAYLPEP